ncbi:MAG TPA: glycosyltransferase 61 family protein [Candidatus Limnocylindrales bacterium]|nr:glycosyltransferase 61 family protein [Candidatus Limnocylindrales bacterium]
MNSSDSFTPEGRFIGSAEYAASNGAVWKIAVPAHRNTFAPHTRFGPLHVDLASKVDRLVPDAGTLEAERLFVVGRHGTVCAYDGTVLPDHSWYRGHVDEMRVPLSPHEIRRLPGRCLSIASDFPRNYSHFILDTLPRIELARINGYELSEFDWFIAGTPNAHCLSVLHMLGMEPSQIVEPQDGIAIEPGVLVAPTFPGTRRAIQRWAVDYLRRRLGPTSPAQRRLYIPRTTRKPVNDDRLIEIAQSCGFEIYRPENDVEGQMKTFASAAVVVAAHGAALANLVFCRPGTRVLELIPTDHVFPYFFAIAEAADLEYAYLAGESLSIRADNEIGPSPFDFRVDEASFRKALQVLTS